MAPINKQVAALVKQRFGPAQRQLQAQAPRSADWYKQYQAIIGAAGQQANQNAAQAVTGVQNLQTGLDTASQQAWAGQQAQMAKDAATRGAQTSPGLADVAHNASNMRNVLTGSYGALLTGLGLNQANYLGDRKTVAKQQGIEALQRNQGARKELAQQRGEFATTTKMDLQARAQAAAEKAAAQAATDAYRNAMLGYTSQRVGIAQQNADTSYYRAHHPRASSKTNTKDPYGNTPLQQRSHTSQFRNIARNAAQLHQLHPNMPWRTILNAIAPDYTGADADVLTGAVQHAVLGRVGPQTAGALRKLGIDPARYAPSTGAPKVNIGKTVKGALRL